MTDFQKAIKVIAIVLAIGLIVAIFSGILGGLSIISYLTSKETVVNENVQSDTSILDNISSLDVELSNYELVIQKGDKLSVSYDDYNKNVYVKDDTLVIKDKKKLFQFKQSGYTVVLTVPDEYFFNKIDISMGTGNLSVEQLNVNTLELELGAGKVSLNDIVAITSVDIEGGAGKVQINDSELTALDLTMGIGDLELNSKLVGSNTIDLGIGDSSLTLKGAQSDYVLDVSKGVGNVTLNGKEYQNSNDSVTVVKAATYLELNCGVGNVDIKYEQ